MNFFESQRLSNYLSGVALDETSYKHADGTPCKAKTPDACPFIKKGDESDNIKSGNLPEGITIASGDVTKFDGDAVINAGNRWMVQGGGVDGAMHRAAGPALIEQCNKLPKDKDGYKIGTGECKLLDSGNMPCKKVLYTVGPDVRNYVEIPDGTQRDSLGNPVIKPSWENVSDENKQKCRDLLRSAYRNCFDTAAENGLKSVGTPSLSTGIFCFPLDEAAKIFAEESSRFVKGGEGRSVKMCLFNPDQERLQKDINLFKSKY